MRRSHETACRQLVRALCGRSSDLWVEGPIQPAAAFGYRSVMQTTTKLRKAALPGLIVVSLAATFILAGCDSSGTSGTAPVAEKPVASTAVPPPAAPPEPAAAALPRWTGDLDELARKRVIRMLVV